MKVAELIQVLEVILDNHGDLDVCLPADTMLNGADPIIVEASVEEAVDIFNCPQRVVLHDDSLAL